MKKIILNRKEADKVSKALKKFLKDNKDTTTFVVVQDSKSGIGDTTVVLAIDKDKNVEQIDCTDVGAW